MRRAVSLAAAFVMLGAATLSAQAANFSGTWTRDTTGMGAMQQGGGRQGGGGGGPMTITMDAKTMTITRTTPNGETKQIFNLDGSDSKNMQPGRQGGAPTEIVSHAKWDGAKLVVTTTRDFNGTAMTTTAVYSLDGGKLVIATTNPPRNGGEATTTTVKYNKS